MSEMVCSVCGKREDSPVDVGVICGDCMDKRGEDRAVGRLAEEIRWTHSTLRDILRQQQNLLSMMSDLLRRVDRLECDRDGAQEPIEF